MVRQGDLHRRQATGPRHALLELHLGVFIVSRSAPITRADHNARISASCATTAKKAVRGEARTAIDARGTRGASGGAAGGARGRVRRTGPRTTRVRRSVAGGTHSCALAANGSVNQKSVCRARLTGHADRNRPWPRRPRD